MNKPCQNTKYDSQSASGYTLMNPTSESKAKGYTLMNPTSESKAKGYTLIEILVGLTIIGILFSFGFASFRDFSRREALSGTSKKIQGDLRLVQSMALSGQKPTEDYLGQSTNTCSSANRLDGYIFKVYSSTEYKIEASCGSSTVVIKDVVFAGDVSISTPSPNPLLFKVLGEGTNIPAGEDASLVLTQTGTDSVATITISAAGEIK